MVQLTTTSRQPQINPIDWIWRFLTSVRVALWIIGLIALCTFIGTLVPQAANAGLYDEAAYQNWLQFQRGKFGELVPVMDKLALFHLFQAPYFRGLLAVLTAAVVLCTINRIPAIWRNAMQLPPVRVGDKLFEVHQSARHLEFAGTEPAPTVAALVAGLRARRYRVIQESADGQTYLYADKNRFGIFGTFVSHTGLVLCILGALMGSILGWRDDVFTITDGSTRAIGNGTDLAVRNDLFVDEYDPQTGQPSDFYTDAVLLQRQADGNWAELRRHRIRVNDPLVENGVIVHQAFFGPAITLKITDNQGNVLFNDGVPLPYRNPDGRPIGWFDLEAGRFPIPLSIFVIGRAPVGPAGDPSIQPGQVFVEIYPRGRATAENLLFADLLNVNQSKTWGAPMTGRALLNLSFERERQFTGLNLSYNPGLPVIWLACGLMLIGWSAVFYLPHRRLRALVTTLPGGATRVATAFISKHDLGARAEAERLLSDLQHRLGGRSVSRSAVAAD